MIASKRIAAYLVVLIKRALTISLTLFKITIPISIVTKLVAAAGLIEPLASFLEPVMALVGLPGATAIVWVSAMVTNLYGGMAAFAALAPGLELTGAQITVLATMMLVAHGLPVELKIAHSAGARFLPMALWRIGGALVLGALLNTGYKMAGYLQLPAKSLWIPPVADPSWSAWVVGELRSMALIFLIILTLLAFLDLLKETGVTGAATRLLTPILRLLGLGAEVAPITVVGMVMGISYGGGLIIEEARSGRCAKRDIVLSLALMGLCHSIFEDTFIMAVMGGHLSGILVARLIFSLIAVALLARVLRRKAVAK